MDVKLFKLFKCHLVSWFVRYLAVMFPQHSELRMVLCALVLPQIPCLQPQQECRHRALVLKPTQCFRCSRTNLLGHRFSPAVTAGAKMCQVHQASESELFSSSMIRGAAVTTPAKPRVSAAATVGFRRAAGKGEIAPVADSASAEVSYWDSQILRLHNSTRLGIGNVFKPVFHICSKQMFPTTILHEYINHPSSTLLFKRASSAGAWSWDLIKSCEN